jgi:beta-glucosidase
MPASDRVERLLAAMTLAEKIGQLNMINALEPPGGRAELERQIRAGLIGSVLNIHGAADTRELQKLAAEQSRLGVPLIFGLDVLHGHHTIFPIPLAEACAFDPALWDAKRHDVGSRAGCLPARQRFRVDRTGFLNHFPLNK